MIMRSSTVWLVPAVVILVSFGPGAARVTAQTITYPFNATYETSLLLEQLTPDISRGLVLGESIDAPYGLTSLRSENNYLQFNPVTNVATSSADPTDFGLQGFPLGSDVLFGSGINKLFGTSISTTTFDFVNGTVTGSGTINITDGEGIFTDATGTLNFTQNDALNLDPTAPIVGESIVSGSIEAVPEPVSWLGTLVIGVIGAGVLLGQRRYGSTSGGPKKS